MALAQSWTDLTSSSTWTHHSHLIVSTATLPMCNSPLLIYTPLTICSRAGATSRRMPKVLILQHLSTRLQIQLLPFL